MQKQYGVRGGRKAIEGQTDGLFILFLFRPYIVTAQDEKKKGTNRRGAQP